jgi:microcystin-dependent protein
MAITSALSNAGQVPVGSITAFAGSAAPANWLLCYGQAVSRIQYAGLFLTLGTTYGSGDGSTTFNLPDLRGRVPAGKDDMGGTAAGLLTVAGSGTPGTTLGGTNGSELLQSHIHGILEGPYTGGGNFVPPGSNAAYGVNAFTTSTGGGNSQNVQPTIILNYIVRAM